MTAEGAGSQEGRRAARPWRTVRQLSARTPLRTKLIAALVALVIFALAALGMVGISILRRLPARTNTTASFRAQAAHSRSCTMRSGLLAGGGSCRADLDIYWLTLAATSSRC